MKKIRIGNDLNITWSILHNEDPFPLDDKDVTLYMVNPFNQRKAMDGFAVEGNTVQWTFYGMDQKHIGKYSLELVVNGSELGMQTVDTCDFVELVAHSYMEGGKDDDNLTIEGIELSSVLGDAALMGAVALYLEFEIDEQMNLNLSYLTSNGDMDISFSLDENGYLTLE